MRHVCKKSDVHNYPTRHAHNLRVASKHKTKLSSSLVVELLLYRISGNLDTNRSICTFKYKL